MVRDVPFACPRLLSVPRKVEKKKDKTNIKRKCAPEVPLSALLSVLFERRGLGEKGPRREGHG